MRERKRGEKGQEREKAGGRSKRETTEVKVVIERGYILKERDGG